MVVLPTAGEDLGRPHLFGAAAHPDRLAARHDLGPDVLERCARREAEQAADRGDEQAMKRDMNLARHILTALRDTLLLKSMRGGSAVEGIKRH